MKILAISDVASKALWSSQCRERLDGVDLILSCGDLPRAYLEYLTNFTAAPILSKNELGEDYGMKKASSIGREWYKADLVCIIRSHHRLEVCKSPDCSLAGSN